jgi:phosphoserine phosphatase RsbU/P
MSTKKKRGDGTGVAAAKAKVKAKEKLKAKTKVREKPRTRVFAPVTGGRLPIDAAMERDSSLALLYEISKELASILERDELLHRIAERVKKFVDYDLFMVMLWDAKGGRLECAFTKVYDESMAVQLKVQLFQGITGHAAGHREAMRVDDVREDSRYIEFPHSDNVRSELVIPLTIRERLVGVLDLESTRIGAFSAENERMLGILGSSVAIALENSRMYQETRDHELRLENDLETAREIQRQLLPRTKHEVPGLDVAAAYSPARQLAGDFYDFLAYSGGQAGLALGDVSGKGTAAALYASLAIGILREHTQDHRCGPEEMLGVLNKRLTAVQVESKFVAMIFAVYDVNLRHLIIANAGSPRPILVRGGKAEKIQIEGTPLGMFEEMEYENVTVALRDGDIVVFASDGILESMNVEKEEFGFERFSEVLNAIEPEISCDEICKRILTATDEFSGRPDEAHDDRTLIVLRVV